MGISKPGWLRALFAWGFRHCLAVSLPLVEGSGTWVLPGSSSETYVVFVVCLSVGLSWLVRLCQRDANHSQSYNKPRMLSATCSVGPPEVPLIFPCFGGSSAAATRAAGGLRAPGPKTTLAQGKSWLSLERMRRAFNAHFRSWTLNFLGRPQVWRVAISRWREAKETSLTFWPIRRQIQNMA